MEKIKNEVEHVQKANCINSGSSKRHDMENKRLQTQTKAIYKTTITPIHTSTDRNTTENDKNRKKVRDS